MLLSSLPLSISLSSSQQKRGLPSALPSCLQAASFSASLNTEAQNKHIFINISKYFIAYSEGNLENLKIALPLSVCPIPPRGSWSTLTLAGFGKLITGSSPGDARDKHNLNHDIRTFTPCNNPALLFFSFREGIQHQWLGVSLHGSNLSKGKDTSSNPGLQRLLLFKCLGTTSDFLVCHVLT